MSNIISSLMDDLLSIADGLIVKKGHIARANETKNSKSNFDYYYMVMTATDTFESYRTFSSSILTAVGLTAEQIEEANLSKFNIPVEYRNQILELTRADIIANFEEKNNYYRMLNGLPDLGDYNLYIKGVNGIRDNIPVHELDNNEIFIGQVNGAISQLIAENPTREYLKFLGNKKIDIIEARTAKNWDILTTGSYKNERFYRRFFKNYTISRNYVIDTMYDPSRSVGQYEGFIGYTILINALTMTIAEYPDMVMSREYMDDYMVNLNLASFGYLDDFKDFPLNYKKRISDNILHLIKNKGNSDIYELVANKVFGFKDLDVYKLKIIKEHNRDGGGAPIFPEISPGVLDYDAMYNIYFAKIKLDKDVSVINEAKNIANQIGLTTITSSDPYWGGDAETDAEILNQLYVQDRSVFHSKYITMNNIYDLTELNYEMSYMLNFLISIKDTTNDLRIELNTSLATQSIFNVVIFLFAAIAKSMGFAGDIPADMASVATIKRFNIEYSIFAMEEILEKYPRNKIDKTQIDLNKFNTNTTNATDVLSAYFENTEIYKYLTRVKEESEDLDTVLLCSELLDFFFTSKQINTIYTKSDNTLATTYKDYLDSEAPDLAAYLDSTDQEGAQNLVLDIWTKLEQSLDPDNLLRYPFLNLPNESSENILQLMFKTMNVFKDRAITITGIASSYTLDEEAIKIVDKHSANHYGIFNEGATKFDTLIAADFTSKESSSFSIYDEIIIESTNIN